MPLVPVRDVPGPLLFALMSNKLICKPLHTFALARPLWALHLDDSLHFLRIAF